MNTATAIEPEPDAAIDVFGDQIVLVRQFTSELVRRGEELGLVGPLEPARIWSRHIMNCGLLGPLLRTGSRVGDVGSGAGLPGLVLAAARPDVTMVLIEPMERRVDWLTSEASRLGLTNVEVIRSRAEDVASLRTLDQLTARAVSALSKLLPLVVPLVRSRGELLLLKGASVHAEVGAAAGVIRRLKLTDVQVLELGRGVVSEETRVFRATVD